MYIGYFYDIDGPADIEDFRMNHGGCILLVMANSCLIAFASDYSLEILEKDWEDENHLGQANFDYVSEPKDWLQRSPGSFSASCEYLGSNPYYR